MSEAMPDQPEPSQASLERVRTYFRKYCEKSGTGAHPDHAVTETVLAGLAVNIDQLGKPLCPCNFYPDKRAEAERREWICACDGMQIFKYCHCLLFVGPDGRPITEHLPAWHEGRSVYGVVEDPTPDRGRALRHRVAEWERIHRPVP